MRVLLERVVPGILVLAGLAILLPQTLSVWIDEAGHTYLTDGEEAPSPGARRIPAEERPRSWRGQLLGEPLLPGSSGGEGRRRRALRAARDDIGRGEMRRGLAELRRLHRLHPGWPEVSLTLAEVERRRGRLEPARDALQATLRIAGELPEVWRLRAAGMLREVEAELAVDRPGERGPLQTRVSEHFRISYDHRLAGRSYGERVLSVLEEVRERLTRVLGRTLGRKLEVRLYTRASYLEAFSHRFGFATVGFYDGAIHVASARQPQRELRALLTHEYAHALFEEALGGHRPFFLNEGIADREEEIVRGRGRLSRGEWRRLLEALRADSWLPLESLTEGFGGLEGERALLAYLESRAAIELIEARRAGSVARWLARCATGRLWEPALRLETGWGSRDLDQALREEVRDRFPEDPLAALTHAGGRIE